MPSRCLASYAYGNFNDVADLSAQVCIVGSGLAGAIIACKLAKRGISVLLVEEGERFSPTKTTEIIEANHLGLWADYDDEFPREFKTKLTKTEDSEYVPFWGLQSLGGSTNHWWGQASRPVEADLSTRTKFGYSRDWPLTWAELEPWLLQGEHEIGVAGNDDNPYASPRSGPFPMRAHEFSEFDRQTVLPGLKKLGWPTHSRPAAIRSVAGGDRLPCMACRACNSCPSGARYSCGRTHIPRFEALKGAQVVTGTRVVRLETSKEGDRIVAAHTMTRDKKPGVIRAERFVLALGAAQSARMLALSKDDHTNPNGLGNQEGQLGQGYNLHYVTVYTGRLDKPCGRNRGFPTTGCDKLIRQGASRNEWLNSIFQVIACPDADSLSRGWDDTYRKSATHDNKISLKELRESYGRKVNFVFISELEGHGVQDLDPVEVDAYGAPLARMFYKRSDRELAAIDEYKKVADKMADAMGISGLEVELSIMDGAHPAGGTAMADSPSKGVCDKNLRVFGQKNLYISSSSVFPHLGAHHPTLTIASMACRLAHHLATGKE